MDLRRAANERKKLLELKKMLGELTEDEISFVLGNENGKVKKEKAVSEWENFMIRNGIESTCPECGCKQFYRHSRGKISADGSVTGKPRRVCLDCGKSYTVLVGTVAEGSSLPVNIQIALLYHTLNNHSLAITQHNMEADYGINLSQSTILNHRHRVMNAIIQCYGMPKLSGTVQVDETYFREGQKGSRHLVNIDPKNLPERKARTQNRYIPSALGINGAEFSCVVTGIDSTSHIAAVVTGLSKGSSQAFEEYFSEYLGEVSFLCSDAYEAYSRYCDENSIPHYIQPSEMRSAIRKQQKEWEETHNGEKLPEEAVRRRNFEKQGLDRLENYGKLTFTEFEQLKRERNLTLDNIDAFHSQLKRYINKNMAGASTVFLYLYVGLIVFKHNWGIDNNNPPTSMADAEKIFAELLRGNYKNADVDLKNTDIYTFERPTTKYMKNLKEITETIRMQTEEQGFTFDSNDRLLTFNKNKYFRNLGLTRLREICKTYHIAGYTTTKNKEVLAGYICKLPEADEIFLNVVAADSVNASLIDDLTELVRLSKEKKEEQNKH